MPSKALLAFIRCFGLAHCLSQATHSQDQPASKVVEQGIRPDDSAEATPTTADLRLDNIRPKPSLHSTAAASTIEREFEAASNTLDPLHEELHVQLGELKFGELLDKGTYKRVYKGTLDGKSIAIVGMRKGGLMAEARTLQRLNSHPNILKLLRWTNDAGNEYIIVELAKLGSLDRVLMSEGVNLTLRDKLMICEQVCSGMCELVVQGVMHRDLASRNVLVFSLNPVHVKISDFGLACNASTGGLTDTGGGPAGSLPVRWTAPEVLQGGACNEKSDIWSFGILMWEVLSDAAEPHAGKADAEVITAVLQGSVPAKPLGCPVELYALMLQCWRRDPCERATFREMRAELEAMREAEDAELPGSPIANGLEPLTSLSTQTSYHSLAEGGPGTPDPRPAPANSSQLATTSLPALLDAPRSLLHPELSGLLPFGGSSSARIPAQAVGLDTSEGAGVAAGRGSHFSHAAAHHTPPVGIQPDPTSTNNPGQTQTLVSAASLGVTSHHHGAGGPHLFPAPSTAAPAPHWLGPFPGGPHPSGPPSASLFMPPAHLYDPPSGGMFGGPLSARAPRPSELRTAYSAHLYGGPYAGSSGTHFHDPTKGPTPKSSEFGRPGALMSLIRERLTQSGTLATPPGHGLGGPPNAAGSAGANEGPAMTSGAPLPGNSASASTAAATAGSAMFHSGNTAPSTAETPSLPTAVAAAAALNSELRAIARAQQERLAAAALAAAAPSTGTAHFPLHPLHHAPGSTGAHSSSVPCPSIPERSPSAPEVPLGTPLTLPQAPGEAPTHLPGQPIRAWQPGQFLIHPHPAHSLLPPASAARQSAGSSAGGAAAWEHGGSTASVAAAAPDGGAMSVEGEVVRDTGAVFGRDAQVMAHVGGGVFLVGASLARHPSAPAPHAVALPRSQSQARLMALSSSVGQLTPAVHSGVLAKAAQPHPGPGPGVGPASGGGHGYTQRNERTASGPALPPWAQVPMGTLPSNSPRAGAPGGGPGSGGATAGGHGTPDGATLSATSHHHRMSGPGSTTGPAAGPLGGLMGQASPATASAGPHSRDMAAGMPAGVPSNNMSGAVLPPNPLSPSSASMQQQSHGGSPTAFPPAAWHTTGAHQIQAVSGTYGWGHASASASARMPSRGFSPTGQVVPALAMARAHSMGHAVMPLHAAWHPAPMGGSAGNAGAVPPNAVHYPPPVGAVPSSTQGPLAAPHPLSRGPPGTKASAQTLLPLLMQSAGRDIAAGTAALMTAWSKGAPSAPSSAPAGPSSAHYRVATAVASGTARLTDTAMEAAAGAHQIRGAASGGIPSVLSLSAAAAAAEQFARYQVAAGSASGLPPSGPSSGASPRQVIAAAGPQPVTATQHQLYQQASAFAAATAGSQHGQQPWVHQGPDAVVQHMPQGVAASYPAPFALGAHNLVVASGPGLPETFNTAAVHPGGMASGVQVVQHSRTIAVQSPGYMRIQDLAGMGTAQQQQQMLLRAAQQASGGSGGGVTAPGGGVTVTMITPTAQAHVSPHAVQSVSAHAPAGHPGVAAGHSSASASSYPGAPILRAPLPPVGSLELRQLPSLRLDEGGAGSSSSSAQ